MLSVIMVSVIMVSVIMVNDIMASVSMVNVIMVSVRVPGLPFQGSLVFVGRPGAPEKCFIQVGPGLTHIY